LQRLGHSDLPSWSNPNAGDSAVASPVNAQPRSNFLLLIGQFANDVNMLPPQRRVSARTFSKNQTGTPSTGSAHVQKEDVHLGFSGLVAPHGLRFLKTCVKRLFGNSTKVVFETVQGHLSILADLDKVAIWITHVATPFSSVID
jgi:hypothetical protein